MAVTYEPTPGGVAELLISEQIHALMDDVGRQAAAYAGSFSPTPDQIRSEVVQGFGRWEAHVTNNADDATRQEWGTSSIPPLHPLARVLDALWSSDPNRRGRSSYPDL